MECHGMLRHNGARPGHRSVWLHRGRPGVLKQAARVAQFMPQFFLGWYEQDMHDMLTSALPESYMFPHPRMHLQHEGSATWKAKRHLRYRKYYLCAHICIEPASFASTLAETKTA